MELYQNNPDIVNCQWLFWRIFKVHPCGIDEYHKYIFNFVNNYPQVTLNYYSMEGTIIVCKD